MKYEIIWNQIILVAIFFIDCHSERSEESDLLPQILRYAQNDKMQLKSFRALFY
jgi:hypothetical protein